MSQPPSPPKGSLQRTAEIDVNASIEKVFNYITNGQVLPAWLKKSGPISGETRVDIIKGPYSAPGASRKVYFQNGDSLLEQLTWFDPVTYYSYSVTEITAGIRHLTSIGYGQWWFQQINGKTHIKWVYSFLPKNIFARAVLSMFLTMFYTKFMNHSLGLAKAELER